MPETPMRRRSPLPFVRVKTTTPAPQANGEWKSIPEPIEPTAEFTDVEPADPLDDAPWRRLPDPTSVAPNGLSHYLAGPSDTTQTVKGGK